MKTKLMIVGLAASAALFITAASAQHEEHQGNQAASSMPCGSMMSGDQTGANKMPGGAMQGNMMSHMMADQKETGQLVEQLQKSFASLQGEKDPAVRSKIMAEHGDLIKQLQTKLQSHQQMMQMMGGKGMMDGKSGMMMDGKSGTMDHSDKK